MGCQAFLCPFLHSNGRFWANPATAWQLPLTAPASGSIRANVGRVCERVGPSRMTLWAHDDAGEAVGDLAITGLGAVSPLGWGVAALWKGLLEGRSGLGPVKRFDASAFRSAGGGEVPRRQRQEGEGEEDDFGPCDSLAEKYLLSAVREALSDARLSGGQADGTALAGTALVVATNFGGMSQAERSLAGGGTGDLTGYEFRTQAERVAARTGLGGPCVALSLSCASGTAAMVVARDLIRAGRAERAVAAGYDELSRYAYAGLAALRATSPNGLRPFDTKRDGTLFSEGAGALVIERSEDARARGRTPYALLRGGALNNDAYHMTAPDKQARGVKALMRAALADAGVRPEDVDHVNLHGTGTKYNDLNETIAMKEIFGERARRIPVTANKSELGHAMGAGGALEAIASVLSIRDGRIPPTIGIEEQDPECDLDVVRDSPREARVRCVLKTSYGIGGTNAAVVLQSPAWNG